MKNDIKKIFNILDSLYDENYTMLELAIVLYLRCDTYLLDNFITDDDLKKIMNIIDNSDTLLSDEVRYEIDDILEKYYE